MESPLQDKEYNEAYGILYRAHRHLVETSDSEGAEVLRLHIIHLSRDKSGLPVEWNELS